MIVDLPSPQRLLEMYDQALQEIGIWKPIMKIAAEDQSVWDIEKRLRVTALNELLIIGHRVETAKAMAVYVLSESGDAHDPTVLELDDQVKQQRTDFCVTQSTEELQSALTAFARWKQANHRKLMAYVPGELMHAPHTRGHNSSHTADP